MPPRRTKFRAQTVRAIEQLDQEGVPRSVTAEIIGSTPKTISARMAQINAQRARRGLIIAAKVEQATIDRLTVEAKRRGMHRRRLVKAMIENIVRDDLFQAVLDDGE